MVLPHRRVPVADLTQAVVLPVQRLGRRVLGEGFFPGREPHRTTLRMGDATIVLFRSITSIAPHDVALEDG